MNEPKNINYAATIAKIVSVNELKKNEFGGKECGNVVGAMVCNSQTIVSKDFEVGTVGVYFPPECRISHKFLRNNNMYRNKDINKDTEKSGYFEENRRLRCVKFRGHISEGLFIKLDSLEWTGHDLSTLKEGDTFDQLNGFDICEKYAVAKVQQQGTSNNKKKKVKRVSRMIDGQYALHVDTSQLKRNMHRVQPDSIISISNKLHGTSAAFGNVLVKRKLTMKDKIAKFFGVKVEEKEYDIVYSSRNVIKNDSFENETGGFYSTNIWKEWKSRLVHKIPQGVTLYGEIVGQQSSGADIQKGYHYGCAWGTSDFYVYRITQTNVHGFVTEMTRPEIDEFCKMNALKTTPLFYYGYAKDVYPDIEDDYDWHTNFIKRLNDDESFQMGNVMCELNNCEVPAEGCVLRIESIFNPVPLKLKNFKFLEGETKSLDAGNSDDIE